MSAGRPAAGAPGDLNLKTVWKGANLGRNIEADVQLSRAAFGQNAAVGPSPSGRGSHVLFARSADSDLEKLAAAHLLTSGVKDATPEQIASHVAAIRSMNSSRDDAAILEQARRQQAISESAYHIRSEAFDQGLGAARGNEQLMQYALSRLGVTPAAATPPVGKPPSPEVAATPPVGKPPSPEVAANAVANPQAVHPEMDNWWTASQPELKDIPVLGGLPRWGLAALGAGTTAASAGLAYHLMAQGQQQSDPVAYAAAVQQMNAY